MSESTSFLIVPETRYNRALNQAITRLKAEGLKLDVCFTRSARDSEACVRRLALEGAQQLIVAGGDGTLRIVAASLLSSGIEQLPSLGLLPLGTANDFAAGSGIPTEPYQALRLALNLPPRPVDLGSVNGEIFLNVSNAGFVAEIPRETPELLKRLIGKQAYGLTTARKLFTMRTRQAVLRGPDFEWSGPFYALMVGNGRMAGGGLEICPGARIDDGLLNLTVIRRAPGWRQVAPVFKTLLSQGIAALPDYVLLRQLPWLEMILREPIPLEADGESLAAADKVRYEVLPRRLQMHLPAAALTPLSESLSQSLGERDPERDPAGTSDLSAY
jgi:lipid kinase YegS